MIKREIVMKMLAEEERREKEEIAKIKEKLTDLREAIIGILTTTPEDLWTFEELSEALKPSKIICETAKKFQTGNEPEPYRECSACENDEECNNQCECEKSPNLCNNCLGFLFEVIQLMAREKEVDVFGMGNIVLIGIYIERME